MNLSVEQIRKDMKRNLSDFRYEHSVIVAQEAILLAKHYKVNQEKAYLAGLIHDIAKEFSDEENVMYINKFNLNRELLKPYYKNIIHADIGAYLAKELYDIDDDIFYAIKFHTIGNVAMNMLSKIIFVADKIARKNKSDELKEIEKLAYVDIDIAIKKIILSEKERLQKINRNLHPDTIALFDKLN